MAINAPFACTPYEYEALTVSTSAVGCTATKVQPAVAAPQALVPPAAAIEVYVDAQPIRVRYDGQGNPTASTGTKFAAGSTFRIEGAAAVSQFKAIRDTTATGDATLFITYLRS